MSLRSPEQRAVSVRAFPCTNMKQESPGRVKGTAKGVCMKGAAKRKLLISAILCCQ